MIVEMKKVSLVMLKKEQEKALKKLRSVGVLHLEELEGSGERFTQLRTSFELCRNAVGILSEVKLPKKAGSVEHTLSDEKLKLLSAEITEGAEKKKSLSELVSQSEAELDRLASWGEVDPSDFDYLSEKGIYLSPYEIPQDKWNLIDKDVKTLTVNRDKNRIRFLFVGDEKSDERPSGLPPEAYAVPMPSMSTKNLKMQIESSKKQIAAIEAEEVKKAVYVFALKKYGARLQQEMEFETVVSGMGKEDDNTNGVPLAWVSGFAPVDSIDTLKKTAAKENWALSVTEPESDDMVPTKLKNNKLVSLIYPLTDFLGTVPGYYEYDISGWFLLFFTVFFGMIFGDAGYGLLLTASALIGIFISLAKKKRVDPFLGLLLLVSLATVAWGTVTCTWFGLRMDQIPDVLKNLSVKPLSNAFVSDYSGKKGVTTVTQNLQIFCFSIAVLQLSLAHVKSMIKNIRSLKFFGDLGSMLMIWGMFYVVLSMVVDAKIFGFDREFYGIPLGLSSVCAVGVGFALSFVFSNYAGNILESVLESVKNIISVLLGVVNVFSDIVSYIRLWAVALAGSAISATVNQMAGPMWGKLSMVVFFLILLVFGHGLNMVLNVLSVIVHGVRLNTLEFSTHLGMSWSGFKYAPFSETAIK
ncbi:ATPase [Treponema parvum]|uniref:ATPase n=1 Tax=Treponema parvum TaxID=138851 RepID=A0A975F4G5_9SPIR|nr:ATPase [Treponema parvum]QTQ14088.1 ATPase [Treponema parvum]